ncbi:640_t:CDS:2, partial [Entrophospora sp. SA101]
APQNSFRQPLNVLKIPEFKQILKENNIDISNVIVHGSYLINLANTIKKDTFNFSVKFLQEEIQRMQKIGLKTLILHPGSYLTATEEEGLTQIAQGLNLVLTENSEIKIALETMSGKDTCHLYSAGYDIKNNLEQAIEEFDRVIGLEKFLHELGAKKDRHENIGYGKIDLPALKKIVHHQKLDGVIKLLETPRSKEYYREEIKILKEN